MFAGFNLTVSDESYFLPYEQIGKLHLKNQKAKFIDKIDGYVIDGITDGTKLEKDWFPMIDADIFISHSRKDEPLANGIAGWLHKEFGLKCFIDSCVWNYSGVLLGKINANFSDKRVDSDGGVLYDHEKCKVASKHVNTMLSVSLQKMIDKTEVTILLNTSNSIPKYNSVYEDATYSPWIYSEIVCTQIVRRKPLSHYRMEPLIKHFNESYQTREDSAEFKAVYEVSLEHLEKLSDDILMKWKSVYDAKNISYPLDYLYKITNPDKMKKLKELY